MRTYKHMCLSLKEFMDIAPQAHIIKSVYPKLSQALRLLNKAWTQQTL